MHHDFALFATITMAVLTAFVGGYIARRLGLPTLVGYLLAGLAIGPFTPGFVGDSGAITQLAEMGVDTGNDLDRRWIGLQNGADFGFRSYHHSD